MTRVRTSRREFVGSVAGASFLSLLDKRGTAKHSIPLAAPGEDPYSLFLSTEASPSERWAAEELRRHIELMTGIRLRIDTGEAIPPSRRVVAIGRSALTDQCGIEPPGGESCLLKTVGETIVIAGGRERGTMYGVSIFLEKLGCRWFTSDVARIPRIAALWLREIQEVHGPAFEYREAFFTEAQGREWSARNRLNGHFHQLDEATGGRISFQPFAHSFYDLVPPDRYFDSHPEYYAWVAGKRRAARAQLCLTNPDLVPIAAGRVSQWLVERPNASIFSISQNDNAGWCECAPCRRVVEEEGGAISGLLLRFVNAVAKQFETSHPDKLMETLAYRETCEAPANARPRPNVVIRFAPIDACQAHSYFTCPYDSRVRQAIETWARIAPRLYVWLYGANFAHYLVPFPDFDEFIGDLARFRRIGVSGIFFEGAGSNGGSCDDAELRAYVAARLLWDPATNVESEIRDFLGAVYGAAAGTMRRYFDLQHRLFRRGEHLWTATDIPSVFQSSAFLSEARRLLAHARALAASPAALRRIEVRLLSLDYIAATQARRCIVRDGSYAAPDLPAVRAKIDAAAAQAQKLGLVELREGYPLADQVPDLRESLRRHRALSVSDGQLTATVVPSLEARLVSLSRGGASENVLRIPSPAEPNYPGVGGLWVCLYPDFLGEPLAVEWRVDSAQADAVTLTGLSDHGLALTLTYRISSGVLRGEVSVENPTHQDVSVALRWRAEFPLSTDLSPNENLVLTGDRLSVGEWVLSGLGSRLRVRNRFDPRQAWRWIMSKTFHSQPQAHLTLWSPETVLRVGQRLSLTSEYELP
jgi:hypothetical protein